MMLQAPPETGKVELNQFLRGIWAALEIVPTFRQKRVDDDYTIDKEDYYVGVTDTSAPRTITLPALASVPLWVEYIVKDESGGAGANNITIDGDGAETIDGAATKVINSNYGVFRLLRGATAWFTW